MQSEINQCVRTGLSVGPRCEHRNYRVASISNGLTGKRRDWRRRCYKQQGSIVQNNRYHHHTLSLGRWEHRCPEAKCWIDEGYGVINFQNCRTGLIAGRRLSFFGKPISASRFGSSPNSQLDVRTLAYEMRYRATFQCIVGVASALLLVGRPQCVGGLAARANVHSEKCSKVDLDRRHVFVEVIPTSLAAGVVAMSIANLGLLPQSCRALTPKEASRQYDTYAATYDQLDGGAAPNLLGLDAARGALLERARGKVLEIGAGTGLNLEKYVGQQISSLTLVDISEGMLNEARSKLASLDTLQSVPVYLVKADATRDLVDIFGRESFDTVVDSFSLCVLGDEGARNCLDQLSQVIKSTGRVLLLENNRSSNLFLGRYQDATAQVAANMGGKGCVYNQDVTGMIRATNRLRIVQETDYAAGLFRAYECVRS
jgi:methyltransferase OMS1, mitochondrial